ncbi:2,3-diaminopropionate biosynthesis protein SbnB [Brenneria goodwinii]|uniref:2,3-diaminopropionate biosynthesis protein SbnB n=1 Tax=Brenneria goodwinii TaxID=1109412 RepID=UPI0036F0948B
MNNFSVITGKSIDKWLSGNTDVLIKTVSDTYKCFSERKIVNPDSYFLRFNNEPTNRIIALPAAIEDATRAVGIKWISSFPDNINHNLNRASAVIILNDRDNGYPIACLEGSLISVARTAASAALGAIHLHPTPGQIKHLVIVGGGPISFNTLVLLKKLKWNIDKITIIDSDRERAKLFAEKNHQSDVQFSQDSEKIRNADMIIFATSAITPYIVDHKMFLHHPTVLHLSLRDIAPSIIIESQNFADDIDHALKANTSVHLAEIQTGHRKFMSGTLVDVINGNVLIDKSKTRIFSPFGMGCLDMAVAKRIYDDINRSEIYTVDDFFPQPYACSAN